MSKRDETRAFIIEKTAPIFNRQGFIGTSVNDMTTATGLTRGSIYGNFRDKDEVALKAFAHSIRGRKKGILEAMRPHRESPLRMLAAYPSYFRQIYPDLQAFGGCPIVNVTMDADDTNPALGRAARKVVEEWREAVIELIRRGIALGEIKADMEPERRASLLISLLEGGLWMAKATGRNQDLQYALDHFEDLLREMAVSSGKS